MGGPTTSYSPLPLTINIVAVPPLTGRVLRPRLPTSVTAALCLGLFIYCMINIAETPFYQWGRDSIRTDESWESLFRSSRSGWTPVDPNAGAEGTTTLATTSAEVFSEACADSWVARGQLCDEVVADLKRREAVDVLYTWTNGTDRLLRTWKESLLSRQRRQQWDTVDDTQSGRVPARSRLHQVQNGLNHFRDHDELRYALRSVVAAFRPQAVRKIHLLTTDLPVDSLPVSTSSPSTIINLDNLDLPTGTTIVGQVPSWLNVSQCALADPPLGLVHHSSIFSPSGSAEDDFLSSSLPSFNSLAIEARMGSIQDLHEFVLYMNDDMFVKGDLAAADVGSPLTGPVFRVQRDLTVAEVQPGSFAGPREGEWPGLRHANWLLTRRFGQRNRGYLAHIGKTFSTPLLREVQTLWSAELGTTSESRFRGDKDEFQTLFLATHYVIERHREALLWSFLVARADRDHNGQLDAWERYNVIVDLGLSTNISNPISTNLPIRTTLAGNDRLFAQAGLRKPLATTTAFDSRDGFAFLRVYEELDAQSLERGWPVREEGSKPENVCEFGFLDCMGPGFVSEVGVLSTSDFFRQMAFERPTCGDCVIALITAKSGPRGLSAFLPELDDESEVLDGPPSPAPEPIDRTTTRFEDVDFGATAAGLTPRTARRRAVQLIQRYSYTIGSTPSYFLPMKSEGLVVNALSILNDAFAAYFHRPRAAAGWTSPTFLTFNDDLPSTQTSGRVDAVLHRFFEFAWPTASPYE